MENGNDNNHGAQLQDNNDVEAQLQVVTTIPRMPMPRLSENLHNVELYFISLEYWFEASAVINDVKRFNAVMAQIPLNDLGTIQTEIGVVPKNGKYQHIKPIIIGHFSDSQQKRFREAINDVQLGDSKPSQLFQKIRRLASDSLTETALFDLWAARLPEMAHAAVIQMKQSPMRDRLIAADALVESLRLRTIGDGNIREVTNIRPKENLQQQKTSSEANEMNIFEKLSKQISEIERKFATQHNSRNRSKSRGNYQHNRDRSKSQNRHSNCWYHWKFGADAKKCREPCNFVCTNNSSDIKSKQH